MFKLKDNYIYMPLQGRIGNQLIQYAFARAIQQEKGNNTKILFDDSDVLRCKWENSLCTYDLPNVEYIHSSIAKKVYFFSYQALVRNFYKLITKRMDYNEKFLFEKKIQNFINKRGIFLCENGFISPHLKYSRPVYLEGYFQSEKYFSTYQNDIKNILKKNINVKLKKYPNINKIRSRNTVCVSIKIEHNVGNSMYSVCDMNYWKRSLDYIIRNVENPYFFICSDNVEYVLEHLIDTSKYEFTVQDKMSSVDISLLAMSECKYFVIGNTTFGWWAQYLSDSKDKIVVAPSKWMTVDMPIDIYQEEWHLIRV